MAQSVRFGSRTHQNINLAHTFFMWFGVSGTL